MKLHYTTRNKLFNVFGLWPLVYFLAKRRHKKNKDDIKAAEWLAVAKKNHLAGKSKKHKNEQEIEAIVRAEINKLRKDMDKWFQELHHEIKAIKAEICEEVVSSAPKYSSIYYIDTQAPLQILKFLKSLSYEALQSAIFYLPGGAAYREQVSKIAAENNIDIADKIASYTTVNVQLDDYLYRQAMEYAKILVSILQHNCQKTMGSADYLISKENEWAAIIAIHDRLVAVMRPYVQFADDFKEIENYNLFFVANPNAPACGAMMIIDKLKTRNTEYYLDHLSEDQKSNVLRHSEPEDLFIKKDKLPYIPTFDLSCLEKVSRNYIALMATFSDKNYKYTSMPLLQELLQDSDCAFFCNYQEKNKNPFDYLDEFNLSEYAKDKRLLSIYKNNDLASKQDANKGNYFLKMKNYFAGIFKKSSNQNITESEISVDDLVFASIKESFCEFYKQSQNSNDEELQKYSYIMIQALSVQLLPLLYTLRELRDAFIKEASNWKAVIVSPGRYFEANIMVGVANSLNIPTFEVQGGTMSPTGRYITPLAQDVLCMDTFSYDLYTQFLNKPAQNTHIIGGIKLDYDVAAVRSLTRDEAIAQIPELADYKHKKIFMLGSQPIGTDQMGKIVKLAVQACKGLQDIVLAIKQHPNESELYAREYIDIARKKNFKNLIILRKEINSRVMIQASDIVSTYYSTIGLESFVLGKPTICINPFDSRPPFDMKSMQIVAEVNDWQELRKILREFAQDNYFDEQILDERLKVLRDGNSAKRAADLINKRIKELQVKNKEAA
jgi:hypothetical protein